METRVGERFPTRLLPLPSRFSRKKAISLKLKNHFTEAKSHFAEAQKTASVSTSNGEIDAVFLFFGRTYWVFAIECGAPSTENLSDFSLDDEINVAVQRLLDLFIFPVIEQRNSLVVQTLHGLLSIGDATIFQREIHHG